MKGWLVGADIIASNGAPSVKQCTLAVEERDFFISVLTLGEYEKGIANLAVGDTNTALYIEARDALQLRFTGRILSLEDPIIRHWGAISGRIKRETGHAPPVIDTLLAATAIEKDLYLVSRNIRNLANSAAAIFDPWRDELAQFPPRGSAARIARQALLGVPR